MREVIEARRAARNRASILARQESIARAQSVGRALIAANDWNIVEVITPRTDVREFMMPFQVPISDIVQEGLDTVLRRVLRQFPVLDFFEPSSIRNIQLNNSEWHFTVLISLLYWSGSL